MDKRRFTQQFKATIGSGEAREITFLANAGKVMESGETVDLGTLTVRDPDTGEFVLIKDLTEGVAKNYCGLFVDHLWSVEKKAGQVRKLWLSDKGLMATATLAHTGLGEDILTLAKDDMLDTFSITVQYAEEPDKDGVIRNAKLLEISAVWLGNDETTALESVNKRKEEDMNIPVSENALTVDEAKALKDKIDELEAKVDKLTEGNENDGDDKKEEPVVEPVQPNDAEKTEVKANTFLNIQKRGNNAATFAQQPMVTVSSNGKKWLDSDDAMKAFRNAILNNRGRQQGSAFAEYAREARKFGLTGDAIVPTKIINEFFKGWTDDESILSTFRQVNTPQLTVRAWTVADDDTGRALGHKKGDAKKEQTLTGTVRTVLALPVYKKISLYIMDLFNDTTGETLRFTAQELASRVRDEIARGAITGDGRTYESGVDTRVFRDNIGLFSMEADIAGNETFQNIVANEITAQANDSLYIKVRKALAGVKSDNGKVVVLPEGSFEEILMTVDANSRPIFPLGAGLEVGFPGVKFFEASWMDNSKYDVIAYADKAYNLIGEASSKVYTDFDLSTNEHVMLNERIVGGSLSGRKAAAGIKTA